MRILPSTRARYVLCSFIACFVLFCSCSDEADFAPPYRVDMAHVTTDASGLARTMLLDDGTLLNVRNNYSTQLCDTAFRAIGVYVRDGLSAQVSQIVPVLTASLLRRQPNTSEEAPLRVLSIWRGSRYLNFHLRLPTGPSAKPHTLGLTLVNLEERDGGKATAKLRLLHKQGDDDIYYYRDAYFSCDLSPLADYPQVDSLRLTIITDRGQREYGFRR